MFQCTMCSRGRVLAILFVFTLIIGVHAQPTSSFTYQGHLKEGNLPANGTYHMEFKLFDAAIGGNQIRNTQRFTVNVVDGLFTVQLDFGAGAFRGEQRWLEIAVNGTTLSPRQEIRPTPYSLFSFAPWMTFGGNIFYNSGKVGIGTNTPTNRLSVVGNADFSRVGIGTTTPTNRLSVVGNADFSGNVGIGTAAPTTKLDVAGPVRSSAGGFIFPDGSVQATASAGIPSGAMILMATTAPPPGYTYTGFVVNSEGNYWRIKTPMPTARSSLAAAVAGNKIYAIGGYNAGVLNTVEEYDPATNTWTPKAPMPTRREGMAAVTFNGKIYVIGGQNSSGVLNVVEEYNPATNTWTTKAPMPIGRSGAVAAVVNDKIYVIGGQHGGGVTNLVQEYDPVTNTWRTGLAPMPTPRTGIAAGVINGKIYVVGGKNITGFLANVEEYNPATNTWRSGLAPMPSPRLYLAAAVVNGKLYAIGGLNGYTVVEEYDPVNNVWVRKTDMITPRDSLTAAAVGNKIYAIGGIRDFMPINNTEEYVANQVLYVHQKN